MISQWRLPKELGGAVVSPVKEGGHANTYKVKVPGTGWTIIVPGECLVPSLPEQPPVNSVVLALKGTTRWSLLQRRDDNMATGWVRPGGTTVENWQGIHQGYDKVHVLLWWDKDVAETGIVASGIRGPASLVVSDVDHDEPGTAKVRITTTPHHAFLNQDEALRAAAALVALAMRGRM